MKSPHVLIADDEPAARFGMRKALAKMGCRLSEAADGEEAKAVIEAEGPDLVFLDLTMPKLDGLRLLTSLAPAVCKTTDIVVITADDSVATAIRCMQEGAQDYLTKPFAIERLRAIVRRTGQRVRLAKELQLLRDQLEQGAAVGAMVGRSDPMRRLFGQIDRAAVAPLDVMINGETGTGKELIARQLHSLSERRDGPFVALNCSAISAGVAESELFGHRRGAFTGAHENRAGVFERAAGGTLFLDEIGDMPVELQAKILRVLQERSVTPVGGGAALAVDIRVVSATHQDLQAAIDGQHFRQDLFYRLCGIHLQVPPLRQRREDIPMLADYFLARFAKRAGHENKTLSRSAIDAMLDHHWPGNVRQLEQVVSAAAAMAEAKQIELGELRLQGASPTAESEPRLPDTSGLPLTEAKNIVGRWFEKRAISAALDHHAGNISAAARDLGVHRQTLQQKIRDLGIGAR